MGWFLRNCDLCSNYGSLGNQNKWEYNSQFHVNSEKLYICFLALQWDNIAKPIRCHNRVPFSRQCIYQLSIFKQQIPKFSQYLLLHFISESWKIDVVLLCTIALYFQIFKKWLLQTMNCCKFFWRCPESVFKHIRAITLA